MQIIQSISIPRTFARQTGLSSWKTRVRWLLAVVPAQEQTFPAWLSGIILALVIVMYLLPKTGVDVLVTYGPAGRGEFIEGLLPRNPRFAIWLFQLFAWLPWKWDYLFLMLLSLPVLAAAVYWGRGRYWKAFLSFPFIWLLGFGQIDAFVAAGLTLSWWALEKKHYWLMGIGFCFACMLKPQVGLLAAICIWTWSPNKWKPLVIPELLILISFLQWGWDWPVRWGQATFGQMHHLEEDWANASLFPILQAGVLLIWIPVIFVPMDRLSRLRSIIAATALSLPYFTAYQMLIVLVFPVSIVGWLLTWLPLAGSWGYHATALMPLLMILTSTWPWVKSVIQRLQAKHYAGAEAIGCD